MARSDLCQKASRNSGFTAFLSSFEIMLCCTMWLLVLICMSTVGGVPVNRTQEATTHAPVGDVPLNDTQSMTRPAPAVDVPLNDTQSVTSPSPVGGIPLNDTQNPTNPAPVSGVLINDTHNATSPASGMVGSVLDSPQLASAETLAELQEDMIVQEGDILIPEDRNSVKTLWPDAIMPYTISAELAYQESNILTAFKMISDFTCIRFKPHTTEFNYLKFKTGNGCASFVGCRGGAQPLYYSQSCSLGNLCHEIIHALGLHHEHTRTDRDQYITVQWQNIMPGRKKNFKIKKGDTLNLPYDINSIMHYGTYFFSVDGSPTMFSKYGGTQMGQRTHLSQLDIQKLNRLYHCDERM